ncbi:exopolysaccharide Pel transporter PelG [uncultured Jannaschia sp.]|uniref:exopolysaccharide Pel transporter PelG n=1 Tax=uncultured Jannaschia sp. TaxID=293347 RepID=UPI0026258E81|nr:exopolysaccharide Pel transporter PelG [uncultured Jannaschia sp.]
MTTRLTVPSRTIDWWLAGNILGPMRRFAGAVVIAAGPWLVSVMALAIVSATMQPVLGFAAIEDVRLTVVYAFCVAPLAAGPIGAVAARLVGAEVEAGAIRQTPAIFLAASLAAALLAEIMAIALVVLLGVAPFGVAAAFVFLTGAAALLWVSFAILTALKAYVLLIWTFTGGMAFALTCIMLATRRGVDTEILVWSFTAGIALSVGSAMIRVRRAAAGTEGDLPRAFATLWQACRRLRPLALGVLCGIVAVWIDKWVFWLVPTSARSTAGFAHYSPYDSVMFVAHLSAVPTYAALLLFHDAKLRPAIEVFRARLQDGSTHARIRMAVDVLGRNVWSGLFSIVFLQAALTACMVMMAPAAAAALAFGFDQFVTLRIALIGVFFHAFFYLGCAVILVCNRIRTFLMLQAGFLVCNIIASPAFYLLTGMSAYAFFGSALVMAVVAFFAAYRALAAIDYLTFLGENDAFYERPQEHA